jgi:ADP-ribosylglycohydrolase
MQPGPETLPRLSLLRSRALGAVIASAAGDALGASYESDLPAQLKLYSNPDAPVPFVASAAWERGEWTDDAAMAIPLLEALAKGYDLNDDEGLGYLAQR